MPPSLTGPARRLLTCALRNLILALIAVCFLCHNAIGQNDLPPVFEIKTDTASYTKLPAGFLQALADPEGEYSLEQVRNSSTRFEFSNNVTGSQLAKTDRYWMRFVLKNSMNKQIKIWLGFSNRFNSRESDIWLIRSGEKIAHEINGGFTPWSQLTGLKDYRFVPAVLDEGESVIVYWRLKEFIPSEPAKRFFNLVGFFSGDAVLDTVVDSSHKQYYLAINDVFLAGVLLFASVFIFFFFMNIREKVYLYFAFYLIVLALGRLNDNWVMFDLFFREFPGVYLFLLPLVWIFALFFLVLFVRELLHVKDHFPKWDKFFLSFNYLYVGLFLADQIVIKTGGNNVTTSLIVGLMIVALNYFIVLTFLRCAGRNRNNRVFLYVILPLQTLWCILLPFNAVDRLMGKPLIPWLSLNWLLIETVLLCLLVTGFCWILLQRYGEMRRQLIQKDLEKEIEKNQLISEQNEILELQVKERTAALSKSLEELKLTQSQLIQSEKMASLGELTAGIAHEIQNPLNFVNNFSEVSEELLAEARGKRQKAKENSPEVTELLDVIEKNLEKINLHGKRADAIVKGMMQHSRGETGVKEPTDINLLAEEYMRLAYHARLHDAVGQGHKAKSPQGSMHKSNSTLQGLVNVNLETELDPNIGKVSVVPQDIGRVLLNLFNNAFYSVSAVALAKADAKASADKAYQPTVKLSTLRSGNEVRIMIQDNGSGIPKQIIDKIFQPFFTTKPTGQGTGLGLSLGYDIIKAHHGEIEVSSIEGEGTTFTIHLNGIST